MSIYLVKAQTGYHVITVKRNLDKIQQTSLSNNSIILQKLQSLRMAAVVKIL